MLYQLSYSRAPANLTRFSVTCIPLCVCFRTVFPVAQPFSGGEGDRTPDLVNAIHALSQLSYAPSIFGPPKRPGGNTASYRDVQAVSSEISTFP